MRPRDDDLYNRIGIYGIRNKINNKIYIGKTAMNFGDRRDNHYSLLNNGKHGNIHLQRAWNKYGSENFEFIIIHDLQENEDLNELEKKYIAQYKEMNLAYNISEGGEYAVGQHKPLSEETKRKIGDKNRINMLGRKASEETKRKMSESHKLYIASLSEEEQKKRIQAMHESKKGVKWTDEQRQKYSEEQRTNPHGAKYDVETVKLIRKLHEKENKSYREISELLNIPKPAVYLIATYRRWKYVS